VLTCEWEERNSDTCFIVGMVEVRLGSLRKLDTIDIKDPVRTAQ